MYQLKSIANFRLGTGAAEILHKGKARSISVMFHIYCIANALQLLIQVKPTDVTWNQFKSHMKSWEIAGAWICSLLCWCDWLRLMHLKIMWDHAIWCIFYPWIHLAPVAESPILVSIGFYIDAIKKKKTLKITSDAPLKHSLQQGNGDLKPLISHLCVCLHNVTIDAG